MEIFLSTLSLRRATPKRPRHCSTMSYFYPRSPCGERRKNFGRPSGPLIFLSTLSLRRATGAIRDAHGRDVFLSTLSLRRATMGTAPSATLLIFLSTLSLRRATLAGPSGPAFLFNFYPRSPCGERQPGARHANSQQEFLSTLSLRRATSSSYSEYLAEGISIHALLAESDKDVKYKRDQTLLFLSTLSLRRATLHYLIPRSGTFNFYPRSPCGERRKGILCNQKKKGISIHALLAESDTLLSFLQ